MSLYFEEQGAGKSVVLVHGLFGSGVNWRGIARQLASGFRVVNVDLPNHGRSPHSAAMTYDDMSDALYELGLKVQGSKALDWVGHSMGGKAVMNLALTRPDCVRKLVVVDIAPVRYRHSHREYIDAMMALDLHTLKSRAQAGQALENVVADPATRLFLLQNLVLADGKYDWRLNLPVLRRALEDIMGFPNQAGRAFAGPVLVLSGEKSDYVTAEGRDTMRHYFPNAEFKEVADAGHWLHAEQPRAVVEALCSFLSD